MILTIWRHGAAEEGGNDRLRELTAAGRDDVGFGSHQLHDACAARRIPYPQRILYSPLVRAAQTARIVAGAFAHARVLAQEALQPGSTVAAVDAAIASDSASDAAVQHTLLVSHQPLVSRLVDHYLGTAGSVPFLPPGGLVTLSLELPAPGCGTVLFWALPPEYEAGV